MLIKELLFSYLLLTSHLALIAQSLYVSENQIVSTTPTATLTIKGTVLNRGFLVNQGTVALEQDWLNEGSYSGNGTVNLVGDNDQLIQHNAQSVGTLKLDGAGNKILESDISVVDTLSFHEGFLLSSSESILQLSSGSTTVNASEFSYIRGPIQFAGTGYRYLPLGTETTFLPLIAEDIQGVDPVLQVEVSAASILVEGERLEAKNIGYYWTLFPVEGSYEGSVVSATIVEEADFNDIIGIVVAQAETPTVNFSNLGQSDRQGDERNGQITSELPVTQPIISLGLTTEYSVENAVQIPSAFAPNSADPADRVLKVYAANLLPENFSFTIFNRWGQVVYRSDVLSQANTIGWNGIDQESGEPVPAGVYPYLLKGQFETNEPIEKTGSITLFR